MDHQCQKLPIKRKLAAVQVPIVQVNAANKKTKQKEDTDMEEVGDAAGPIDGVEDVESERDGSSTAGTDDSASDKEEAEAEPQQQDSAIDIAGQSDARPSSPPASVSSEPISFGSSPSPPGGGSRKSSGSSTVSEILFRVPPSRESPDPSDSPSSTSSSGTDGDNGSASTSSSLDLSGSTLVVETCRKRKSDADDHLGCPTLRRRFKALKSEHAMCSAVIENVERRLSFADRQLRERDDARRNTTMLQQQIVELRSELGVARAENRQLERSNAVLVLSAWVLGLIFGGWAGKAVGRELQ